MREEMDRIIEGKWTVWIVLIAVAILLVSGALILL